MEAELGDPVQWLNYAEDRTMWEGHLLRCPYVDWNLQWLVALDIRLRNIPAEDDHLSVRSCESEEELL